MSFLILGIFLFIFLIVAIIFLGTSSDEVAMLIALSLASLLLLNFGYKITDNDQTYIVVEKPYLIEIENEDYYLVKVRNNNKEKILGLKPEQVKNFEVDIIVSSIEQFDDLYDKVILETKCD